MALHLPKLSPWRPKGCHLAGLFSIRVHTAATSFVFRWRSLHAGLLGLAGLTLTLDVYLTWSLNFRIVVRSKVFARRTIDMKKAMLKKRSAASNFGKQSAARVRTQISFCLIAIIGLQIAVAGQQGSPEAQNVFRSPDNQSPTQPLSCLPRLKLETTNTRLAKAMRSPLKSGITPNFQADRLSDLTAE